MPAKGFRSDKTLRIASLANAGLTTLQIVAETGYDYFSVYDTCKREGCPILGERHRSEPVVWSVIQAFYDEGNTTRQCITRFGVTSQSIANAVQAGEFRTRSHSDAMNLAYANGSRKPMVVSERHRKILSASARARGLGGDKPTNKYEYGGYKLCSSYELRVAKLLDSQGIVWIKPKTRFEWTDATGKGHTYHPDLYIPSLHLYLDPKNSYCIKRDIDKIERVRQQNCVAVMIVPLETIISWENAPSHILRDLTPPIYGS